MPERTIRTLSLLILGMILVGPACQRSASPTLSPTILASPPATSSSGQIYYIRPDGGSYEECDGLSEAPYPGQGTRQACAWNHPFQALPPGGVARIAGGDTLILVAGSYKMGYGAPGAENCDVEASYDCHLSPLPSGPDPDHPTRLLGAGWDGGCKSPPEFWGAGRPWFLVNLTDSSNVEVSCLEITDHSSCIEDHLSPTGGSPYTCQRDTPPYGDWAATGLYAEDSSHVLLKDLNIHGLANTGIRAGRLVDWTVENVRIIGNGWAGWDGDIDGEDANSGDLIFREWRVEWNGCGETYPKGEHLGCWGQEAGGDGDGVGTGTTGGHWIIEDSAFLYNTSDGLDLLYARQPGTIVEIRRTIAAGNDGNQIKLTAAQAIIENSVLVGNCGFFDGYPYWNKDDTCRASGDALVLVAQPGASFELLNSTLTGEGNCLMIAGCALDRSCDGSERIKVQNTLFQGQKVFFDPEADVCLAWYDDESNPPLPANPFAVEHSLITGVRFGNITPCSNASNLCVESAGLTDSSLEAFDGHLQAGSLAIDAGAPDGASADDYEGRSRDAKPDIGAFEWLSPSGWWNTFKS